MKKGFGSVFILLILSSMILISMVFIEASCTHAAESAAQNYCLLTGRSILAEYQPELFSRYGLFMVRGYEDELSKLARFYLTADLELSSSVLNMSCLGAFADTSSYCGLETDLFLKQAEKLGAEIALKKAVSTDRIKSLFEAVRGASLKDISLSDLEHSLSSIESSGTGPNGTATGSAAQARTLRSKLKASKTEAKSKNLSEKEISSGERKQLPSAMLGVKGRSSLLFTGGILDISAGDVFLNTYIQEVCSNGVHQAENTYLKLETEYVLYGDPKEAKNQKSAENSLKALRYPLNMASILKEPVLMQAVNTAANLFPMLPRPLVVGVLTAIWAGIETKADLNRLYEGKSVPLFKTSDQFLTSLSRFMSKEGRAGSKEISYSGFGSYEDYLGLLLLLVPEDDKAARLMDVMQLNLKLQDKASFTFRDYAYGFDLEAVFTRRHYASDPFLNRLGGAYVRQTHTYR